MKLTRFAKAILYLAFTALLLLISTLFHAAMHSEGGLEEGYFRSNSYLFILAAVLLGTAVYSYAAYTRRHSEHRTDSLLFFLVGLALMVTVIFAILQYGGLEGFFEESGYTAANINIVVLTALPLPFLIRAVVLACSTGETSRARRLGAAIAAVVLVAAAVVLVAVGGLARPMRYVEDSRPEGEAYGADDGGDWESERMMFDVR